MSIIRRVTCPVFALSALGVAVALAACMPAEPDTAQVGRDLFMRYCASCHGESGAGDGPVASMLGAPVADLTTLAERWGGSVELSALMARIDGREEVPGHGTSDMPVWGAIFEGELPGRPEGAHLSVLKTKALSEYVASLQKE